TGSETLTGGLNVNGHATFAGNTGASTVTVTGGSLTNGPVLSAGGGKTGVQGGGSTVGVIGTSSATTFNSGNGSGVMGTGAAGVSGYGTQWGMVAVGAGACCGGIYAQST